MDVSYLMDRFREVFCDKQEIDELFEIEVRQIAREEVSHLPTKDEFYEEISKIYKKQQNLENEENVLVSQVSRNRDNISVMARKLKIKISESLLD